MTTLKIRVLNSFWQKTIGLLGQKKAEPVLFRTRFGIHTFGLKFPIDVLILDSKNRVTKIKTNLPPFHFFFWNPLFNTVIELPVGEIAKLNIRSSDTLEIIPC